MRLLRSPVRSLAICSYLETQEYPVNRYRAGLIIACLSPIFLLGCGPKMGQVHGKITFEGKPVTAGSVNFAPKGDDGQFESGSSAQAAPDENGEFQLSTKTKNDGALVGRHEVSFLAPGPPRVTDPSLHAKLMESHKKFGNLRLPPGYVVEVKPGVNNITLELERAP